MRSSLRNAVQNQKKQRIKSCVPGIKARTGRPVGQSCSPAGNDRGLRGLPQERRAGRRTEGHPPSRAHRSAARGRGIPRALGGHGGPRPEAAEAWSKTQRNSELSHVSPEFRNSDSGRSHGRATNFGRLEPVSQGRCGPNDYRHGTRRGVSELAVRLLHNTSRR